jgi:hypothetical protein
MYLGALSKKVYRLKNLSTFAKSAFDEGMCSNFQRLKDEIRRLSWKSFSINRGIIHEMILKHQLIMFSERMRDERVRDENFTRGNFFTFSQRVKWIFISHWPRKDFCSVLSQLFTKRVVNGQTQRYKEEKWKFLTASVSEPSVKWKKKYFHTHNFLVNEKRREKKCWLRITCCSFLTHTQTRHEILFAYKFKIVSSLQHFRGPFSL